MAMSEKQRATLVTPVQRHLDPDEQVVDVSIGALHGQRPKGRDRARPATVVVTDRRVVFFRRKLAGYDLQSLDLGRIVAVDHGQGLTTGELRLTTATGDVTRVTSVPKDDVERLAGALRQRLAP